MAGHVYSVLFTLISSILVIAISLVLYVAIKCRIALWQFKRRSNGLPIYDNVQILGNTIFTLAEAPEICLRLHRAHKRLGKTFGWLTMTRYGVHTIDLDLLKRIVIDRAELNRSKTDFPLKEIENSILMAEDDQWKKLRRNFAPAFKSSKFKSANVIEEIDMSIQKLVDHIEQKLDIQTELAQRFEADELMHKISLQVIFSCFYKQSNLIDFADEHCYWTGSIDDMLVAVKTNIVPKIALIFPALNPLIDWLVRHFHPQGAWRRSMVDFIRMQTKLAMEARKQFNATMGNNKSKLKRGHKVDMDNFVLADGTKFKKNMIDHMIDKYLDGKLTEEEFFDTSFLIVLAGDKTTADAMVHLMYLLAINQDEQEQCREAIKRDGYDADYLSWSINESLRLLPPVPAGCSRTIKKDLKLENGYVLPAGSFVISDTFTIHRLPEYWGDDSNEFNPSRWKDTKHHHPLQYQPFGYGQRGCLGKEFALFTIKKVFSALLTRYKLEAKQRDDTYAFDVVFLTTIIPKSKTFVTIKRL